MSSPEGSTVTFRRTPPDFRRRAVELFARRLQQEVAHGRPFDCLIAGDADLRRLNREFRGQDYPTDVLSFPATPPAPDLGSLAISYQRARAQAREFGHGTEHEVAILMLHGLLHLMGLDHETDSGRMARAEKRWRTRLGLNPGLIERARDLAAQARKPNPPARVRASIERARGLAAPSRRPDSPARVRGSGRARDLAAPQHKPSSPARLRGRDLTAVSRISSSPARVRGAIEPGRDPAAPSRKTGSPARLRERGIPAPQHKSDSPARVRASIERARELTPPSRKPDSPARVRGLTERVRP